jgi:hypothetical protein
MRTTYTTLALAISLTALVIGCGRTAGMRSQNDTISNDPAISYEPNLMGSVPPGGSAVLTPADQQALKPEIGINDTQRLSGLVAEVSNTPMSVEDTGEHYGEIVRILSRIREPKVQSELMELARYFSREASAITPSSPPAERRAIVQRMVSRLRQFIQKCVALLKQKYAKKA